MQCCGKSAHHLLPVFLYLLIPLGCFCQVPQKVTMIVHHAVIYTADKKFTVKQAMAISKGKVVATGNNETILKKYRAETVIDAAGKFVYPGLIDAHCHFTGYATDMWKCDVTGTSSFEEIISILKKYALTSKTTWLYGRGWDQNDWPVKTFPDKSLLDSLFPGRPVFLKRIDGHAALANQSALDMAGVTGATPVEGGSIEVKNGLPTGLLLDNAMDLVERRIPLIDDVLAQQYFLQAQDSCFQYGITGVHDCGISEHTISLVDEVQQTGALKMKIFALLSDSAQYYERWIKKGPYKTGRLHVGGFKVYADGALGSRGACLLQPYSDKKDWYGFLLNSKAHLKEIAAKLEHANFQLCTHAIGDSANREVLNVYQQTLKRANNKRWRIEHAQVVNENDVALFGKYNIVPSIQPAHATSDMYWVGERLGEQRLKNAYAYKKLLDQNGWIPLGTDFPVEDINPFNTFYAAVARMDRNGFPAGGFQPEGALSRKEALLGMTIWAARAAFEEKEKGSLEPGKAADFFMMSADIMHCELKDIPRLKITATFINGEKVFSR